MSDQRPLFRANMRGFLLYLSLILVFGLICIAHGRSMLVGDHFFWDARVYAHGISTWKAGLVDPYSQEAAYDNGQEIPMRFVYPPLFLKSGAAISQLLPGKFSFPLYLAFDALAMASIPWLLATGYVRSDWLTPLLAAFLFTLQPRFLMERALLSGNMATLFYALVLAAGALGLRRKRWLFFYLAVCLASLVKPTFLMFLLLPLLAGEGQLLPSIFSIGAVFAAYAAERLAWPGLSHSFSDAVYAQVVVNHDFGLGLYGYFARLGHGIAILRSPEKALFCHFAVIVPLVLSVFLLRKRRGLPSAANLWVPALLVLTILANPRLQGYDADIAVLPALYICIDCLQHVAQTGTRAMISAVSFTLFLAVFTKDGNAGFFILLLVSLFLALWRLSIAPAMSTAIHPMRRKEDQAPAVYRSA